MADELTTKRIINLPAESAPAAGDVFVVDNETTGTKKLPVEAIIDTTQTKIIADDYKSTRTYSAGDYCIYNKTLYRCIVAINTAEAWNAEHWLKVTVAEELTQNNERLDMLVTMQEVEPEPLPDNVQCLNPANTTTQQLSSDAIVRIQKLDVSRDGRYFGNPYNKVVALQSVKLYNEYDEEITLTTQAGNTITSINTMYVGESQHAWFTVEDNGYTLKIFVRNGVLANTWTLDSKLSYFGANTYYRVNGNPANTQETGITYGEKYVEYVPYGDTPDVPVEYELAYNIELAKFVQNYMEAHGTGVSNRIYDVTYPENSDSEFVNVMKYYHDRAERETSDIIRIGSFNKFISRGSSNWPVIKQELADHSLDICGFQECPAIISDGAVTDQIGQALQGWQFHDYAVQDASIDKAIVSQWEVATTNIHNILTRDDGNSTCIQAVINLYPYKWYSNFVSNVATLSVYCYHGISQNKTIGGVAYTSYQIRMMEIANLINIIAQDTSDFIVIVGDTNCFEPGFDAHTGTHAEWEAFRTAGFTPVLAGYVSTVTADLTATHFAVADNGKVYCDACYDQIFIGANIQAVDSNVVDSNLYPVESLAGAPVSDHCMIYADLKFDFDAIMQRKLNDAMT